MRKNSTKALTGRTEAHASVEAYAKEPLPERRAAARRGRPTKPPTTCIRVPDALVGQIRHFVANRGMQLPVYGSKVQAGQPSAADDHVTETIDLNTFLIHRPASTFAVYATGDSMIDAGIDDGDMLIVDSSILPAHGKIVVAAVDGELTVKHYMIRKGEQSLMAANPAYLPINVNPETGAIILGVVTGSIKKH